MVREVAVPRLTEIERQRKRRLPRKSAGTRQHFTTKPLTTDTTTCTTTPAHVTTYVRAGALVPPPPCLGGGIRQVGGVPVNTHSTCPCEGRLWVARCSLTTDNQDATTDEPNNLHGTIKSGKKFKEVMFGKTLPPGHPTYHNL